MSGTREPAEGAENAEQAEVGQLSRPRKVLYAGCVVFGCLVAIEGAARLLVLADVLEPAPRIAVREAWALEGWEVDSLLGWRLLPDTSSIRGGGRCVTNSFGQRDHELPREKPRGEFRMLSIGDSTALGYGVSEREAYAGALEDLLREKTGRPVEVINAGVPGYTSAQALLYLEHRGLSFDPDAVIVQVNFNDRRAVPPGDSSDSPGRFVSIERTLRLRESLDYSMTMRLMRGSPDPDDDNDDEGRWFEAVSNDFREVEVDSPARVSLEQYEENIRAIVRLSKRHGADVYLIGLPDYPDLAANVRRAGEAAAAGDWDLAEKELADEVWFGGSEIYRLVRQKLVNRIHVEAGRPGAVQEKIPVNLDWTSADGYLPTELSGRYIDLLRRLGEEFDATVIVPHPVADSGEIYLDYIHLNAIGHRQVAHGLATAIARSDAFKMTPRGSGD